MPKQAIGFTVVELLIVIVILMVLAMMTYLIIDPVESSKRGRDAIRLSDINLIFKAVHVAIDLKGEPSPDLLCVETPVPCSGSSRDFDPNVLKSDGTGWVKTKIDNISGVSVPVLPHDPANAGLQRYEYYSNGYDFEVNAEFESKEYQSKMQLDGGDNDNRYELGTRLNLIH